MAEYPHPVGSARQLQVFEYIQSVITNELKLEALEQVFEIEVPNPIVLEQPNSPSPWLLKKTARNIIAYASEEKRLCRSFRFTLRHEAKPGLDYRGANDSLFVGGIAVACILFSNLKQAPSCDVAPFGLMVRKLI